MIVQNSPAVDVSFGHGHESHDVQNESHALMCRITIFIYLISE